MTRSGLHYAYALTVRDGRACAEQTYSEVGPQGKAFTQSSRFCGPSTELVPPTLIQVTRPRADLILDRPTGCGAVRIGRGAGPLSPANTRCSATAPHLRLTVLPPGRSLTISGITGVRTLALAQFACAFICTRQLAAQR